MIQFLGRKRFKLAQYLLKFINSFTFRDKFSTLWNIVIDFYCFEWPLCFRRSYIISDKINLFFPNHGLKVCFVVHCFKFRFYGLKLSLNNFLFIPFFLVIIWESSKFLWPNNIFCWCFWCFPEYLFYSFHFFRFFIEIRNFGFFLLAHKVIDKCFFFHILLFFKWKFSYENSRTQRVLLILINFLYFLDFFWTTMNFWCEIFSPFLSQIVQINHKSWFFLIFHFKNLKILFLTPSIDKWSHNIGVIFVTEFNKFGKKRIKNKLAVV